MQTLQTAATDFKTALEAKGKRIRSATGEQNLRGGCAVVVTEQTVFLGLAPLAIGITNGQVRETYGQGQDVNITFNYSAFKDSDTCSCSGGPATMSTPTECLRATGLEIELQFWNWNGNFPGPNRGVSYTEFVPLFVFYQTKETALVKPGEVDATFFEEVNRYVRVLPVDAQDSFSPSWEFEGTEPTYWRKVTEAYALPRIMARTNETIAVEVVYKVEFSPNTSKPGTNPPRQPAYFRSVMLLYSPRFKPLAALPPPGKESLLARPYYRHVE